MARVARVHVSSRGCASPAIVKLELGYKTTTCRARGQGAAYVQVFKLGETVWQGDAPVCVADTPHGHQSAADTVVAKLERQGCSPTADLGRARCRGRRRRS